MLPPLADLHRHLDGSLRPATVADLASERGLSVPPDLAFSPGMGLDAALARFAFTLSAYSAYRDHTNRRMAITRFAAWRSERSDVLILGSSRSLVPLVERGG